MVIAPDLSFASAASIRATLARSAIPAEMFGREVGRSLVLRSSLAVPGRDMSRALALSSRPTITIDNGLNLAVRRVAEGLEILTLGFGGVAGGVEIGETQIEEEASEASEGVGERW